ncbi:MAG: NAD(P)H-hydrate dehydratase, partial [Pseudobutyrivibrio sp.]|nr:NAD(P)H-hydrate dehydratase [Pseudobutyrivibrio sp.]
YTIDDSKIELYDLVVDAMFGIGLTRGLEGKFLHAAEMINENANSVVAVDIPSGYDTDTGRLLGAAGVHANMTITFAYMKKGLVLGDCKAASGDIQVADVGIYAALDSEKYATIVDDSIFSLIKPRPVDANKGTCGKLLIIAGSENIYGACYLSAKAALASGAGLVKIFTHKNNISTIQNKLPEAMYIGFDSYNETDLVDAINWADVILVGPGLGTNDDSNRIVDTVLKHAKCPVVIDADGINLAAQKLDLLKELTSRCSVTLTPHLKEMERLTGTCVKEIKYNIEKIATDFAEQYNCTVILKDSTTVIATPRSTSYIISGNEGLATPGSGDVLAGVVASFIGQNINIHPDIAPIAAAHLHGRAGSLASERKGIRGVLASDIIEGIREIL